MLAFTSSDSLKYLMPTTIMTVTNGVKKIVNDKPDRTAIKLVKILI